MGFVAALSALDEMRSMSTCWYWNITRMLRLRYQLSATLVIATMPIDAAPNGRNPGASPQNNRTATSISNNGNRGNNNGNRGNNNNINIGNDVNIDVDRGWDHDHDYHPVARAAVATAIVVGTRYTYFPTGCTVYPYRSLYYYCGSYYLQPYYSGTTVTYVVVVRPG